MSKESQTAAVAGWSDWLLFLIPIATVLFVMAMWTTSIPVHIGA